MSEKGASRVAFGSYTTRGTAAAHSKCCLNRSCKDFAMAAPSEYLRTPAHVCEREREKTEEDRGRVGR